MGRTYNGRFFSPEEPKSGTKWLVAGLVMIPLWSMPVLGVGVLAGSVCCFVKAGRMNSERRMYRRFHEFCAVIGMRQRVSFKELAKVGEVSKGDVRQYLQRMIAKGYFGSEAYLDVGREELILPPPTGWTEEKGTGGWKDTVLELIAALRGDRHGVETEKQKSCPPERKIRKIRLEEEVTPEAKPETKPEPKTEAEAGTASASTQEKKSYMDALERTLDELYQLNEKIEDEGVSARIDRIGALTAGIFRAVIDDPEREQEVRRFMNYYLPTTLKLLKSYDMLEEQSYQGANIAASRKKIENVLDMLIEAYEKLLDGLFRSDALDIASDIDVLETMIAGDGLSSRGQMKMM